MMIAFSVLAVQHRFKQGGPTAYQLHRLQPFRTSALICFQHTAHLAPIFICTMLPKISVPMCLNICTHVPEISVPMLPEIAALLSRTQPAFAPTLGPPALPHNP